MKSLNAWLGRLSGVLVRPTQTFGCLFRGEQGGVLDVVSLMFVVMLITSPLELARAVGSGNALLFFSHLINHFVLFALWPLVVTLSIGLLLAGVERLKGNTQLSIDGLMTAASYLWVPVGLIGIAGALLWELGVELIILPHIPLALFLQNEPTWTQILLRCLVAYGPSAFLLYRLFAALDHKGDADSENRCQVANGLRGLHWLLLGYLVVGFGGSLAYSIVHYEQVRPIVANDQAADFSLPRSDGSAMVRLSSLRSPVVVEFWATWCSVCTKHLPALQEFAKTHPTVPVVIVHQGDTPEEVERFVSQQKWTHLISVVDHQRQASLAYRVNSLPSVFVIEAGRVKASHVGAVSADWLRHALEHADHVH